MTQTAAPVAVRHAEEALVPPAGCQAGNRGDAEHPSAG